MLLESLRTLDVPASAYQLQEMLHRRGTRIVAMSIYRALERLIERDLVEKVGMLSAFRAKDVAKPLLMVCVRCGRTRSLSIPDMHDEIARDARRVGFTLLKLAVEAAGVCDNCRLPSSEPPS